MATEKIEVIVSEKGARTVKRELSDLGSSAEKSAVGVNFLKKALIGLGAGAIIRGLINLADSFTNIQNRLRNVTEGTEQLNVVTEDLFNIANDTRQSVEATAEVYARTALAVKDLGKSQAETLAFTKSLNQAVTLSGAAANEAQAGLIQLSQGLASGTLRGDELRSVLEQLPAVADVIAKSLGVTRGELRSMGQDGKITADIIFEAFAKAREELDTKFKKTIPTIGQAFQVLKNEVLKSVGAFGQASGASTALARTILFLAGNIDTITRAVAGLAFALGVQFGVTAINRAILGLRALKVALATNPIGLIAVALTTVIGLLVTFSDKLGIASDTAATLQDVAVATFQIVKESFVAFLAIFKDQISVVKAFFESLFGEVEFSIKGALQLAAKAFDGIGGLGVGTANAITAAFKSFPGSLKSIFADAFNGALKLVQSGVNKLIAILNKLPSVNIEPINFDNLIADSKGPAQSLGESVADAFNQGFASSTAAQDVLGDILTRADELAKARADANAASSAAQDAARAKLGESGPNLAAGTQAANEALKIREQLLQDIKGPQEQLVVAQDQLNDLFKEGAITLQEYNLAMTNLQIKALETQSTAFAGFRRGLLKIKADILDVSNAAEHVLTNAFSTAEDALVQFVQTGQFNFSGLVDSILADLTRLLARQALAGLLNSLAGAAGGGGGALASIVSSLGSSGARAAGGPVQSGRSFLVGERGPELFTPQRGGSIVPNDSLINMAAAPPQVNVQVVNVQDPNEIPAAMASQQGDKTIINSLTRNRAAVKNALGIA